MLKLDEYKSKIIQTKKELEEVTFKLSSENEKLEEQLTEIKKDFNAKTKKIKDGFYSKVKSFEEKKKVLEDNKMNLTGEIYMEFINKNLTQEQLDELTTLIKG